MCQLLVVYRQRAKVKYIPRIHLDFLRPQRTNWQILLPFSRPLRNNTYKLIHLRSFSNDLYYLTIIKQVTPHPLSSFLKKKVLILLSFVCVFNRRLLILCGCSYVAIYFKIKHYLSKSSTVFSNGSQLLFCFSYWKDNPVCFFRVGTESMRTCLQDFPRFPIHPRPLFVTSQSGIPICLVG